MRDVYLDEIAIYDGGLEASLISLEINESFKEFGWTLQRSTVY